MTQMGMRREKLFSHFEQLEQQVENVGTPANLTFFPFLFLVVAFTQASSSLESSSGFKSKRLTDDVASSSLSVKIGISSASSFASISFTEARVRIS